MRTMKRYTPALIKSALFIVFALLIFMIFSLLTVLFHPAKDITEPESAPPVESQTPSGDQTNDDGRQNYEYTFSADLSAYEIYMNPESDEYLFLVNTEHRLDENYAPDDLTDVANTRPDRSKVQMREYAAKALEALFLEAEKQGMTYVNPSSGQPLNVISAYRTYAYQQQLLDKWIDYYSAYGDQAEQMATREVQYPGASEHQTGLCCDMLNLTGTDTSFENERAGQWLAENCYKFGFILRYPKDKVEITGISYEPWHFRYVGRYHATKMHELGMCLEEYMDYLDK